MAETELVIFMPIFLSSLIISGNYIVKVPKLGMTLSIFFIKSFLQHIIIMYVFLQLLVSFEMWSPAGRREKVKLPMN